MLALLVLALLCVAAPHSTAAQRPHRDVRTSAFFAKHVGSALPTSEVVSLVVSFSNEGEKPFNVSAVHGWLSHPMDASVRLHNFTGLPVTDGIVDAGKQMALDYRIVAPRLPSDEPLECTLFVVVYYQDARSRAWFASTVYNSTVRILPSAAPFEARAYMSYLLAAAVVVALGSTLSSVLFPARKRAALEGGAGDDGAEDASIVPASGGRRRNKAQKA